ncbi:MAG: UbiA prenyltransferase family protein [Candidatus Bathyarchaeia archaeon]|nr:UbiA prenyltransferase family protein [Candidatus Bathyarchaeota archaeon]
MNLPKILNLTSAVLKSRAEYALIAFTLPSVIGFVISSAGPLSISQFIKLVVAVTSVAYSIYLNNDLWDLEDDIRYLHLGKPSAAMRPLAQGLISKKGMKLYVAFFAILGLSSALLINIQAFLAQLGFLMIGYAYSIEPIKLKKRFIVKYITLASGAVLSIFTGGFASGGVTGRLLFFVVISFVIYFGLGSLNDLRDFKWDKENGIRSFPVVLGPKITVRLMLSVLFGVMAGFILGYYQFGFNIAFPVLGLIILAGWSYSIYPLFYRYEDESFVKKVVVKRTYPFWMMLLLTILLGSFKF